MELIIFAIVFLVMFAGYGVFVLWFVHIVETKDYTKEYGWGNHRKFKQQFNSRNWIDSDYNHMSLFRNCYSKDSDIRSGIISFNNKGMLINNPISYLLALLYVNRHFNKKRNKVKW